MLNKLRDMRKKFGYTQEDMAQRLDISPQTYSVIERGDVRVTYERAVQIADIFGVTPDEIFLPDMSNAIGTSNGTEGV